MIIPMRFSEAETAASQEELRRRGLIDFDENRQYTWLTAPLSEAFRLATSSEVKLVDAIILTGHLLGNLVQAGSVAEARIADRVLTHCLMDRQVAEGEASGFKADRKKLFPGVGDRDKVLQMLIQLEKEGKI